MSKGKTENWIQIVRRGFINIENGVQRRKMVGHFRIKERGVCVNRIEIISEAIKLFRCIKIFVRVGSRRWKRETGGELKFGSEERCFDAWWQRREPELGF